MQPTRYARKRVRAIRSESQAKACRVPSAGAALVAEGCRCAESPNKGVKQLKSITSLEAAVARFTEELTSDFETRIRRRAKVFKNRVLKLVSRQLPPYPRPTGRPQQQRITRAAEIYLRQCAEIERGTRKRVTWSPIALRCIPRFRKIRSEYKRRAEIKRLRDSVYRRIRAQQRQEATNGNRVLYGMGRQRTTPDTPGRFSRD